MTGMVMEKEHTIQELPLDKGNTVKHNSAICIDSDQTKRNE